MIILILSIPIVVGIACFLYAVYREDEHFICDFTCDDFWDDEMNG